MSLDRGRARAAAAVLLLVATAAHAQDDTPAPAAPADEPTTGALRLGVYSDSDGTQVLRSLAQVTSSWGAWSLSGSAAVDVISSASVDVRSSPGLSAVDVVTSASSTSTSGGRMSDKRLQATGAAGWKDGLGHGASLTSSFAVEGDYASVSGGLNGSVDVAGRNTTLLGGLAATRNWVKSVLDRTFAETSYEIGYTAGIAQVVTPNDALRLRYDGSVTEGYQASPYRNVRFGNWTTSLGGRGEIMFENTLGSPSGLPEKEPRSRTRHAAVVEWVHALGDGVGLHGGARLGHDSWSIDSLTASLDLRVAGAGSRVELGYRFYLQSAADFFQTKYTLAPSMYADYTSDKELGRERGHVAHLDVATVLKEPQGPGDSRLLLDGRVVGFYYSYPGFALIDSRASVFVEVGLTWEL